MASKAINQFNLPLCTLDESRNKLSNDDSRSRWDSYECPETDEAAVVQCATAAIVSIKGRICDSKYSNEFELHRFVTTTMPVIKHYCFIVPIPSFILPMEPAAGLLASPWPVGLALSPQAARPKRLKELRRTIKNRRMVKGAVQLNFREQVPLMPALPTSLGEAMKDAKLLSGTINVIFAS